MAEENRVVLIGGHGKVALLAAPKLVERGYAVDSMIRNAEHAAEVEAAGANPVVLDIESSDIDQLADVFKGASAVVFSAGAGGGNEQRTRSVDFEGAVRSMKAAQQAGVKRYVMVSYSRALVDVDLDYARIPSTPMPRPSMTRMPSCARPSWTTRFSAQAS